MFKNLSYHLQSYKNVVGSVAGIVTIGQFFSGAFICKDIYKNGSSDGIPPNPFIGGIVIGLLMLQYSFILNDSAMLVVNIAAIVLNTFYLLFYIAYVKTKKDILKPLTISALLLTVLLSYAHWEQEELIEYRFGFIVTALMLLLLASPLLEVRQVISNRDSTVIPFPIVLSGTLVTFLWLLYGIILQNDFMIFQNSVGFVLCLTQVILCFLYPRKLAKID